MTSDKTWVSASQLDLFDGTPASCMRKWAWRHIERIELPPHPAAAKGSRVHKAAELYLGSAFIDLTTEEGQILLPGLSYLPPPLYPGMKLEHNFGIQIGDTWVRGFIDCWIPEIPLVLDHKTTGNTNWAKTPEDLLTDTQANIYAINAVQETGADSVNLRWVYYSTKTPFRSHAVDATVGRDVLEPAVERVDRTGRLINLARKSDLRALDYPPNPEACGAYGGCPFVSRCNLSQREIDEAFMIPFEEQLRVKLGGGTNGQANWTPAGAPPQESPTVQDSWTPPAPAAAAPVTTPVQAADAVQQWVENPTAGGPQKRSRRSKEEVARDKGFTLYIGCAPTTAVCEDFAKRVPRIQTYIEQGANVTQAIEHDLHEHPPTGALIITPTTPLAAEALPVLQTRADMTVRAFQ